MFYDVFGSICWYAIVLWSLQSKILKSVKCSWETTCLPSKTFVAIKTLLMKSICIHEKPMLCLSGGCSQCSAMLGGFTKTGVWSQDNPEQDTQSAEPVLDGIPSGL